MRIRTKQFPFSVVCAALLNEKEKSGLSLEKQANIIQMSCLESFLEAERKSVIPYLKSHFLSCYKCTFTHTVRDNPEDTVRSLLRSLHWERLAEL